MDDCISFDSTKNRTSNSRRNRTVARQRGPVLLMKQYLESPNENEMMAVLFPKNEDKTLEYQEISENFNRRVTIVHPGYTCCMCSGEDKEQVFKNVMNCFEELSHTSQCLFFFLDRAVIVFSKQTARSQQGTKYRQTHTHTQTHTLPRPHTPS